MLPFRLRCRLDVFRCLAVHDSARASDYGYWGYLAGKPVRRPLEEIKVKSEIARPDYEPIALNQKYTVIGAAWAGETRFIGRRK